MLVANLVTRWGEQEGKSPFSPDNQASNGRIEREAV